jgi:trk system potassium uptake protein TrkH
MIDLRPVVFVIGTLITILALAMIIPAIVDYSVGHADWQVFAAASAVTLFVGVSMILTTRSGWIGFNLRQAFVMTNLAWLVIATFGALPFVFSDMELSVTDSFFESMSGVTTTGATVIVGLDHTAPGILLWRAILQWLGGIGIIVMAVALLPILQVGGMQLFRVEAFDADKVLPRAAQIAGGISIVYVFLTGLAALILWALGLSGFDAVAHAMTSIATGGFSTHDASVGYYDSAAVDWSICGFMILGSLPFVLYLRALRGNLAVLVRDSQVRWFLIVVAAAILLITWWLWRNGVLPPLDALRYGAFNVVSVMTGTGYATAEFDRWGGFSMSLMFVLMFVGGCAGSTTCGIKIFRFQVHRPIPEQVSLSVMGFFFLFTASFALLAAGLGFLGLDFITAVSGAASAIANVGPGLGPVIGPDHNYSSLPAGAKWLLSAGMLLGRLELFTVLVLLSRSFWRG